MQISEGERGGRRQEIEPAVGIRDYIRERKKEKTKMGG